MVKGRAQPYLQRPVESVKVPEFEMDFCYLLQDPKRRHHPGDQAWATTLEMIDVAAQNPLCAAVSTKSDESADLSALCTTFVKRMAYAKAVLKVDPEPAFEVVRRQDCVEDKRRWNPAQRLRQLQDSVVKALVQLGEHKSQWKARFDACGSSWKHVSRWK